MLKKDSLAFFCLIIGFILSGFANNKCLAFISVLFLLIALALDVSIFIEWHKNKKKH